MRSLWPRGGLWRQQSFLRLWGSQTVSQVGTQVSALALPLAAILTLEASASEVALLSGLEFLPWLVLALPAGVWIDRLRRKPILIGADLGRALVLASVPAAYALDVLTIWQLYAVAVATGAFTVFFDVAYQSYLPSIVGRDRLVDGNSKLEFSRSAASMAGPGIGGALVAAITAPFAILVDAVSFLVSAWLLVGIRAVEPTPEANAERSMRHELAEGLRYLLGHRYWRAIAASTAWANLLGNVAWSVALVYVVRDLGLSAAAIGLVLSLASLGFVLGAILAPRVSARFGVGPTIVVAAALGGLPLLLIPLAPREHAIPFLTLGIGLSGIGVMLYNISGISLMQALTPERLLGRLNASRRFIVWGTIPLGSLIGAGLAATIGLRPTIFVGTILGSLSFLPVALSPVRTVREIPSAPEADPFLVPATLGAVADA